MSLEQEIQELRTVIVALTHELHCRPMTLTLTESTEYSETKPTVNEAPTVVVNKGNT